MLGVFKTIDRTLEMTNGISETVAEVYISCSSTAASLKKQNDQNEVLIEMLKEELRLARQERKELQEILFRVMGIVRQPVGQLTAVKHEPIKAGIDWRKEKERLEAEARALYWENKKKKEESEMSPTTSPENTTKEPTGTLDSQPMQELKV